MLPQTRFLNVDLDPFADRDLSPGRPDTGARALHPARTCAGVY